MNLEFLQSKWNLLVTIAGAIITILAGFVDIPSYAAIALGSDANYESLGKLVLAIVIAIMLVPCTLLNKKKHVIYWGAATILLLLTALFIYFKSVSNKKETTVDYTSYSGGYVVKGNNLLPENKVMWIEIEKAKGSKLTETEFFAENHDPNDSTGRLTASILWPDKEIESNAKKIIYYYLFTLLLFALSIICAVQTVYCITATGEKK